MYGWLFRAKERHGQDLRIGILLEEDAFHEIWKAWKKLGYPFDSLVASYATSIGVSGDTPKAPAELAGIIASGGVRYPLGMSRVALCHRKAEDAKPYSDALIAVGLECVLISPDTPLESLDIVEGLLLSGGSDLNPKRYGATLHPATGQVDDATDELELRLVTEAVEKNIPALCICRGMQILNAALGGTLHQDIPNHRVRNKSDPGKPVHGVAVRTETLLSSIVGAASIEVNSRHHQAVDQLGSRLAVSGVAPDGIIEAIEVFGGGFLLGVQWHPENQIDQQAHRLIFEKFATAFRRSD